MLCGSLSNHLSVIIDLLQLMQQTINLLQIIDSRSRRHSTGGKGNRSTEALTRKDDPYRFGKIMDFSQAKYSIFPRWLTQKRGFTDFMYDNYEHKLLSIPAVCEKEQRSSDEKYMVWMYLQNLPAFATLPSSLRDIVLSQLLAKSFKAGEVVHEGGVPAYVAVVFVGILEVQTSKGTTTHRKNELVLKEAFRGKELGRVTAVEQTILLFLPVSAYALLQRAIRAEMQANSSNAVAQLIGCGFFTAAHLKEKRARALYSQMKVNFYFPGEVITETGEQAQKLYILTRGEVREQSHIYLREHNKWPLPNNRWEVRAVYNSHHKTRSLPQYAFFGDEEMLENMRMRSKYTTQSCAVLLSLEADIFHSFLSGEEVKRLKKFRTENVETDYGKFEERIRKHNHSTHHNRTIALKAINTAFAQKQALSPKKAKLLRSFEHSMLKRANQYSSTVPL